MSPLPTARTRLRSRAGLLIGMLAICSPILATTNHQSTTTQAVLPDSSKLLTRCFRSMGGETRIEAIQSMDIIGSISIQEQVIASIVMKFAQGKRSLVSIKVTSDQFNSTTEFGCDGTTAWELERNSTGTSPERARLLSPSALNDRIKANNWLGRVLHLASDSSTMKTTGKVNFNGRESWAVDVTTLGDALQVYFDIETRLVNGFRLEVQAPLEDADADPEPIYLDIVFGNWKSVQDIMFFHEVRILQGEQEIEINYDSISIDTLEPGQFTLPPVIQAVVDEQAQQATDPTTDPD